MKTKLLSALAALLMTPLAQAEVYECKDTSGRLGAARYLLALTETGGIIYKSHVRAYQNTEREVLVTRAMDGGPINVRAKAEQKKVDWDLLNACYVWGKSELYFNIQVNTIGDSGSFVRHLPVFITAPDVLCPLPRPIVPPALPLECELL